MKVPQKHSEIFTRDSMTMSKALPKLLVWLILLVSASFTVYTTKLLSSPHASCDQQISAGRRFPVAQDAVQTTLSIQNPTKSLQFGSSTRDSAERKTRLEHIVFGIAASAKIWGKRKEYIKLWWNPEEGMRGIVWLDRRVKTNESEAGRLPQLRISSDTSSFAYKNKRGHRSAVRISRIVSETLRSAETENVRWLVMGDDDTVFVAENLVRVLNNYDHEQFYYIGSSSESHLQNINFSYGMAYGGGGFAISYPLAVALEKMQDRCIQRYPGLYGSDDRIQACMAELGVPLTKEVGFHQFDVHGSVFGLLAAHPVAPLVSLHHLDVVDPIFPNATRVQALQRLKTALQLDSAALMQQSICYDTAKSWTVSVSWGFAVQIFRGVLSPREVEMPARTFLNWYKRGDHTAYAFNTRPLLRNPCQKPFVFFLSTARFAGDETETVSVYTLHRDFQPECKWDMADPMDVDRVEVYKKPDPHLWDRSPRRNCCRVLRSEKKSMVVDVGVCREGEMGLV